MHGIVNAENRKHYADCAPFVVCPLRSKASECFRVNTDETKFASIVPLILECVFVPAEFSASERFNRFFNSPGNPVNREVWVTKLFERLEKFNESFWLVLILSARNLGKRSLKCSDNLLTLHRHRPPFVDLCRKRRDGLQRLGACFAVLHSVTNSG